MRFKSILFAVAFAGFFLDSTPQAHANPGLIARGLAETLFSVVHIPKEMIARSGQSFPLGLVAGTVGGTMKAVAGTVVGVADMARGAAPYAKYAALAFI